MVLGLFVEGERRHDVKDCDGSCVRMKARGASGKRYFTTPKGKKYCLGAAKLGFLVQGGV